jgi:outer membrane protein OmpA-like peptidoglycan-associated protein
MPIRQSRFLVPLIALVLSACGGPRPIYAPLPSGGAPVERPRPPAVKPTLPSHPSGPVPAAILPPALSGPLTAARVETYMDALETDLRRHVHARGIVTARRGNEIAVSIDNALLFAPGGGVAGGGLLEPLASLLRGYAHVSVAVGGFTDTAGPAERNLAVSQQRARQIADALVRMGVPANRVGAAGFGETHLRVQTGDDKNEPRNRRIEIVLKAVPG